ncbi:hypothetical protein HK101_006914, partial [Irineochytrium annulatum]
GEKGAAGGGEILREEKGAAGGGEGAGFDTLAGVTGHDVTTYVQFEAWPVEAAGELVRGAVAAWVAGSGGVVEGRKQGGAEGGAVGNVEAVVVKVEKAIVPREAGARAGKERWGGGGGVIEEGGEVEREVVMREGGTNLVEEGVGVGGEGEDVDVGVSEAVAAGGAARGEGGVAAEEVGDRVEGAWLVLDAEVELLEVKDPADLAAVEVGLVVDPDEGLVVREGSEGSTNQVRAGVADHVMECEEFMLPPPAKPEASEWTVVEAEDRGGGDGSLEGGEGDVMGGSPVPWLVTAEKVREREGDGAKVVDERANPVGKAETGLEFAE